MTPNPNEIAGDAGGTPEEQLQRITGFLQRFTAAAKEALAQTDLPAALLKAERLTVREEGDGSSAVTIHFESREGAANLAAIIGQLFDGHAAERMREWAQRADGGHGAGAVGAPD